jgi:hypothetical protein
LAADLDYVAEIERVKKVDGPATIHIMHDRITGTQVGNREPEPAAYFETGAGNRAHCAVDTR